MTSNVAATSQVVAPSARRLRAVDALRATAALMVVLRHSALGEGSSGLARSILTGVAELGAAGVGLFLVISGFSIHLRWAADPEAPFSPVAFWRRRFVRLYPTYYVALAVVIVATLAVLGTAGLAADRAAHEAFILHDGPVQMSLWATVLTHVSLVGANVWFVAMLPQAWSLALEEQIYALYTVALRVTRALRPLRLVAGSLVLALAFNGGVSLLAPRAVASGLIYTQLPSRLFEWMLGLLAAEVYVGKITLPPVFRHLGWGLATLVAAGAAGLGTHGAMTIGAHQIVLSQILYHPLAGVGFFIVLNWAVWNEDLLLRGRARLLTRLLAWMGLFSYTIYLLHPAIMRLVGEFIPGRGIGRRVVLWLAVIGGSYAFYVLVERRFIQRSRSVGRRRRTSRSVSSV